MCVVVVVMIRLRPGVQVDQAGGFLEGGLAVGPGDDFGEGEAVGEHGPDGGAGAPLEGVAFGEGDHEGEGGCVEPLVAFGGFRAPAGLAATTACRAARRIDCSPAFVSVIVCSWV